MTDSLTYGTVAAFRDIVGAVLAAKTAVLDKYAGVEPLLFWECTADFLRDWYVIGIVTSDRPAQIAMEDLLAENVKRGFTIGGIPVKVFPGDLSMAELKRNDTGGVLATVMFPMDGDPFAQMLFRFRDEQGKPIAA